MLYHYCHLGSPTTWEALPLGKPQITNIYIYINIPFYNALVFMLKTLKIMHITDSLYISSQFPYALVMLLEDDKI